MTPTAYSSKCCTWAVRRPWPISIRPQYFYAIAHRRIRYSVGTLLNLTAGLPFRLQTEYEAGEALFWDITGELARHRGIAAPPISPQAAGQRLAQLGSRYTITLFESYLTDFAGHSQDWEQSVQVLNRVDSFLESLVNHLDSHTTLVISSDHGNLEDLSTKRHTLNPVPLIAGGSPGPGLGSGTGHYWHNADDSGLFTPSAAATATARCCRKA